MLMGDFKQAVLLINNQVNIHVFGQGLLWQKIDISDNKVVIIMGNKRIVTISHPEMEVDKQTRYAIDGFLIDKFKTQFNDRIKAEMGLNIVAHMKGYDREAEQSASVIVFDGPIASIVKEL